MVSSVFCKHISSILYVHTCVSVYTTHVYMYIVNLNFVLFTFPLIPISSINGYVYYSCVYCIHIHIYTIIYSLVYCINDNDNMKVCPFVSWSVTPNFDRKFMFSVRWKAFVYFICTDLSFRKFWVFILHIHLYMLIAYTQRNLNSVGIIRSSTILESYSLKKNSFLS